MGRYYVSMLIGLSVSLHDYSKCSKSILTKHGGRVGHGPRNSPFNFGAELNPGVDTGIKMKFLKGMIFSIFLSNLIIHQTEWSKSSYVTEYCRLVIYSLPLNISILQSMQSIKLIYNVSFLPSSRRLYICLHVFVC